jgi:hypothetical protein
MWQIYASYTCHVQVAHSLYEVLILCSSKIPQNQHFGKMMSNDNFIFISIIGFRFQYFLYILLSFKVVPNTIKYIYIW